MPNRRPVTPADNTGNEVITKQFTTMRRFLISTNNKKNHVCNFSYANSKTQLIDYINKIEDIENCEILITYGEFPLF